MYRLSFDGQTVYDPRGANDTDKLIIADPAVTLAVNAAGSVSFAIYPNHPLAGKISRMRGTLALEDDNGTIFRGRILNDEATFYGAKKYTAEGALAYLNDSIVDPYTFPGDFTGQPGYASAAAPGGNLVAWWLGWLLNKHNAQAPADRQIKLGTVTVRDPNNYITRENSKYSSTWETISDKLVGSTLGGYLIMRYEDDGNYLDYLAALPRTNPQRVRFADNLLDIIIKVTGDTLFTAILPVGADGLTLAGLPDGPLEGGLQKAGKIIYDPAAEVEYGSRITRVITWDDVTLAENLRAKAATELTAGVRLPESISVKACDLYGVDGVTPHFRVGQYVRVESAPHGISAAYPLLEMAPNILDPGSTTINLNTTKATFTAQVRKSQLERSEQIAAAVREMSHNFDQKMQAASGLYPTEQKQPGGSTIWLLHDKPTLEESSIVIKVADAGIGLSTDGGATYPYGYTVTGDMIMNEIAAHGIKVEWLLAGIIDAAKIVLSGEYGSILQGKGGTVVNGVPVETSGLMALGPKGLAGALLYLSEVGARLAAKDGGTELYVIDGFATVQRGVLRIEDALAMAQAGQSSWTQILKMLSGSPPAVQLGNDAINVLIQAGQRIRLQAKEIVLDGAMSLSNSVERLYNGSLSSGSTSWTDGHSLYVILGQANSSKASLVVPSSAITSSQVSYLIADESNYRSFYLSKSGGRVTLAIRSGQGEITSVYGVL